MLLSELKENEQAYIVKVRGRGAFRKRITEMGFVKGKEVKVIKPAPLKDPIEYSIMDYEVSLRKSEANLIEVIVGDKGIIDEIKFEGTISDNTQKISLKEKINHIHIALVGNPNCGKTTLFNYASGSKEHVGNYSGVTVDAKKAKFKQSGYTFEITDLPGTYSLTAYSPEELYVRKYILDEVPDIVVNVIDASNLERNMYLTARLIDMDIKVVVALNMYDEFTGKGDKLDYISLGKMLGVPIVPTSASHGKGINELFEKVIDVYEEKDLIVRHIHINYGKEFEKAIKEIQAEIQKGDNSFYTNRIAPRFMALSLLEKDFENQTAVSKLSNFKQILQISQNAIKQIEASNDEDTETLITDARYGFINGALKETLKPGLNRKRKSTEAIDSFLTNKIFGFPIFIFFMWLMFQTTFSLGQYPMDLIDSGVSFIADFFAKVLNDGILKDLLVDGIINGVGGVIVFLPNILILFFFISLMEDTGYMARAAFIMDKLMHKIGLHGKSFIPLVMGFGCNVPAIMSTRTIENRNDRLLTMLINPFMSCSARLPVYIVIIGAVFPKYAGSILFLIYGTGIVIAILIAKLFKKIIFKSEEAPFVMELPPYRLPVIRTTVKHMWRKASQYLQKMGGIILVASIIIWTLEYFPRESENSASYEKKIAQIQKEYTQDSTNINSQLKEQLLNEIESEKEIDRQANSYIGKIGYFIEPVIRPLGFDQKIGVSIVAGIAAKEIVVSTMGVLYSGNRNVSHDQQSLKDRIREEVFQSGEKKGQIIFTGPTALALLVFVLIYFPCIATIAVIKKESGSWKWPLFTIVYTTVLAWILSFAIYQIGTALF